MLLVPDVLPTALRIDTGTAGEPVEGLRLELGGIVTEAPSTLSDGLGLTVDDGTGPVRLVVGAEGPRSGDPGGRRHGGRPADRSGQRDSAGNRDRRLPPPCHARPASWRSRSRVAVACPDFPAPTPDFRPPRPRRRMRRPRADPPA